jgi:hypothetical protein
MNGIRSRLHTYAYHHHFVKPVCTTGFCTDLLELEYNHLCIHYMHAYIYASKLVHATATFDFLCSKKEQPLLHPSASKYKYREVFLRYVFKLFPITQIEMVACCL